MPDQLRGRRPVRLLATAAAAALTAIACGTGGGSSGQQPGQSLSSTYNAVKGTSGGQLVYSDWEQVTDLNPISTSAATTVQANDAIWSDLWRFGPDDKPVPDMVTEVPTADNGMVKKL